MGAYTRIVPHRKRCIIVTEFLEIPKTFTTIYASVNTKKNFRTRLETLRLLSAASSGLKSQNDHPLTLKIHVYSSKQLRDVAKSKFEIIRTNCPNVTTKTLNSVRRLALTNTSAVLNKRNSLLIFERPTQGRKRAITKIRNFGLALPVSLKIVSKKMLDSYHTSRIS